MADSGGPGAEEPTGDEEGVGPRAGRAGGEMGAELETRTPRAGHEPGGEVGTAARAKEIAARMPTLSARAGGVLRALARADRPEDILRVAIEAGADAGVLARELPAPAARLLHEVTSMRTLPKAAAALLRTELVGGDEGGETAEGPRRRRRRRSGGRGAASRTLRGAAGASGASADATQGVGKNRLMKLSTKLMDLIHLAEVERRQDEAARQVRRSEERVEDVGPVGSGPAVHEDAEVTVQSLQREVLDAVRQELELLSERSEGGPDVDVWWK